MWVYEVATGRMIDRHGRLAGHGYTGFDNGDGIIMHEIVGDEDRPGVVPVPEGRWLLCPPFFHPDAGPYTMRLLPVEGTDTGDRDSFLLHGDALRLPGTARHGCIVMPRALRMQVWNSGDHEILVVRHLPTHTSEAIHG